MRILLFGNTGQLGWELERSLSPLGPLHAVDFPQVNLAEPESCVVVIRDFHPQVIVNATAYTAVDRAESESDLVMAINAIGPGILMEEALRIKAALIHYSTDYVFDGSKSAAYIESDIPNPLSVYGKSKLAGEQAIRQVGDAYLTLRTAWVYSLRRDSFVTKVLAWARSQPALKIVNDQVSNPTWARLLADTTALLLARAGEDALGWITEHKGLYHLAGDGYASRYDWAKAILSFDPRSSEQVVKEVLPALTSEFPTPAQRPLFSALNCGHFKETFGLALPDWKTALKLAMT